MPGKANGVDYLRRAHFLGGGGDGIERRLAKPRHLPRRRDPAPFARRAEKTEVGFERGDWLWKCLQNAVMSGQDRVLGKRILLVDDDPGARESIKLLLNIDRHSVLEASNGREALELFHQGILDLVIIDYFMPQMEGRELAENIKLQAPKLPILMVTAYLEKLVDTDRRVDAVLAKPFGVAELREAIAKLLN